MIKSSNSKNINFGNLKYPNHQVLYRLVIMGFKDLSDLWKFPESTPTTVFWNTINISRDIIDKNILNRRLIDMKESFL